jgi:peptidoglycan/xylan/chitin deacetylase (PgdA/CDA1 family)
MKKFILASLLTTLAVGGCSGATSTPERICSDREAISSANFNGSSLPNKTLVLTFDDGPGARTEELSHFLRQQGISATFFVNGKMLTDGTAILKTLVDDGHTVANHTQTHANLTGLSSAQVVDEVRETDDLISPFITDGKFLFRPPYGYYDNDTYEALNHSDMNKYVGPINWDIHDAADWDCWQPSGVSVPPVLTVAQCGSNYLDEIRA